MRDLCKKMRDRCNPRVGQRIRIVSVSCRFKPANPSPLFRWLHAESDFTRFIAYVRRNDATRLFANRNARCDRTRVAAVPCRRRTGSGRSEERQAFVHHDFQSRCTQPAGYVRHEAGCTGGGSRTVQSDFDQRRFSTLRNSCPSTPRSPTSFRSFDRVITPPPRFTTPVGK